MNTAGLPMGDDDAITSAVNAAAEAVAEEAAKLGSSKQGGKDGKGKGARKETKKRVRRVGKAPPGRKAQKHSNDDEDDDEDDATGTMAKFDSVARVLSKHDEKWNIMFDKLVEFRNRNDSTLVPQCYHQDPRLGRWVHYQRVEYWIFQQTGNGKITPDRIARLEGIGFEWDPQRAQWNQMFQKLEQFKEEIGHCKVPKGYSKDPELANWVRNQRLEQANMIKGKRSRMTEDRFQKLDVLGFKWSTTMPVKSGASSSKPAATKDEADKGTTDNSKNNDKATMAAAGKPSQGVGKKTLPKGNRNSNGGGMLFGVTAEV